MERVIKMSGKFEDYCLEYIKLCAILNHLRRFDGTFDELHEVIGAMEEVKHKMRRELSK